MRLARTGLQHYVQHSQTESGIGHEPLNEKEQEAELLSYGPSKKISSTTQKEKFGNLEYADSYKTSYETVENSFQHNQIESGGGHEYLGETRHEVELSSHKTSKKISSTTHKGKYRNSISSAVYSRDYENKENSGEHFLVNPWTISSMVKHRQAKGHIVHSWDILFDMGRHGLEVTLRITDSELSVIWVRGWEQHRAGHNHQPGGELLY